MKKISSGASDGIIIGYIIKAVLTAILSLLLFNFLFSEITYKLDLRFETAEIFTIFTVLFTSFLTAFISVSRMKNNGALLGIICQIPLIFYMLINLIFNGSSWVLFIIKLAVCILCGVLGGILRVKQSRKIKV